MKGNDAGRSWTGCTIGPMCAAMLGIAPAIALSATGAAAASDTSASSSGTELEELVVTARKRDETLISVPVAVTVVGLQDIKRYDAADLTSIGQLAPNLIVAPAQATAGASFNLRGIGSSSQDAGIDSSVNVLIDGAPIPRGRIITASMFDLQQVEVLEGPQALFFGKNSSAGVISLTSAGPTKTLQGAATTGYEFTTDQRFVESWVAGPITDAWKFRVALRASESDGFIRNVSVAQPTPAAFGGPDYPLPGAADLTRGHTDDLAARATLQYNDGGPLDGTFKVMGGRFNGNADNGNTVLICRPGLVSAAYGVPDPTGVCGPKPQLRVSLGGTSPAIAATMPGAGDGQPYTNTNLFLGSLALNYHFSDITVSSQTGYSDLDYKGFDNYDWTTFAQVMSHQSERNQDVSQEFRIASDWKRPINFVAGGYYEHFNREVVSDTIFLFVGPDPAGRFDDYNRPALQDGKTLSGFGQLRWDILENIEADVGARYTHETKHTSIMNRYLNPIVGAALGLKPEGEVLSGDFSGANVSPEATLTWHPDKEQTLYAAYKQGYKSGGFAAPGILTTNFKDANSIQFQPEVAKGEEIGYKAELLDHSLRVEVTAFLYRYSHLQVVAFDSSTLSYNVENAGEAETKGVETKMQWRVIAPLTVRGTISYDKARYLTFRTAQCYATQPNSAVPGPGACYNGTQDLSGRPTLFAPEWVGSLGATYETPSFAGLKLALDADTNYSGGYFVEASEDPFEYNHTFWLFNAGLRLRPFDSDKWEVGVFGKNLGDHLYLSNGIQTPAQAPGVYAVNLNLPRTVQIQGTYRF